MKEGSDIDVPKTGKDNGGYVHCVEKTSEDNVDVARTKEFIRNSHNIHHEIQGSSDFILIEEPGDDGAKRKNNFFDSTIRYAHRWIKLTCTKKKLYKRIPILSWLPRYNNQDALGDLVAGITIGLTVIPQSLAYANVAGLPTQVCLLFLLVLPQYFPY